jgi:23S rRNA pseudouridine1911/1915/1917 synthase
MAVINPPGGKTAITDYETLATDPATKTALILCHLHTGRTHQIRVHMHHLGTPILGDPVYGKKHELPTPRLLLHAWQLTFNHPVSGKNLHLTAPQPEDFKPWLERQGA